MGNLLETCMQRGGGEKQEDDEKIEGASKAEEQNEDIGSSEKADNKLRIKVVLKKQELEWLVMHCKENNGSIKGIEELLLGIQKCQLNHQNHDRGGWRPVLDSIMEIPEVQFVEP